MGGLMIVVPVVVISGVITLINLLVEMNQGRPIANIGQQILVPVGTMVAFAIVGDFEDAVYCWRTQAAQWADRPSGILLASGAGALGVRLGLPVTEAPLAEEQGDDRPELGTGEDADPDFMQSTIGLVWRTLVLAVFLLALVWVSGWIGG